MRPSLRIAPVLAVLALGIGASSASAQVTTGPATKVGNTDAVLTGDVETNGVETTCNFIWGVNPDDLANSTDPVTFPGDPSTTTTFSALSLETVTATITGLDRNNIYWYQLVCNDEPGEERAFAAGEVDPDVQQQPVNNNPNPNPNPTPPDNTGTTPGNGSTAGGQGQGAGQGQASSNQSNSQQQLPPLDNVPPKLVISPATQRNGFVAWTVVCPATEQTCAGTVTLRTQGVFSARIAVAAKKHRGRDKRRTLGSASYRLKGGEAKTVRVKINKYGRALLAKHQDVKARATFVTTDAAGNESTTAQIITLHADAFRHN
jgi:hypothetical protein